MENKHGINNTEIHFTPLCDKRIRKYDIIGNESLERRLYCVKKGVFVIITPEPEIDYLTDDDLKLKFNKLKL